MSIPINHRVIVTYTRQFPLSIFTFAIFISCLTPLYAQKVGLKVSEYKLDNGFTIILNEDKGQPKVFGGVCIKAGSKNDPADATGLAHYLEHLLFKGTEQLGTKDFQKEKPFLDSIYYYYDKMAQIRDEKEREKIRERINYNSVEAGKFGMPNEFDKLLKSIGSEGVNAFTSNEITFYHNTFPPSQIERWIDLYAHRFQNPVFRSFQSELEVVYEEKNRGMDNFFMPLLEKVNSLVFKKHPYGTQSTIGTIEHLKNPSLTKMYSFFNTYYVANNMALVLSGNFDTEEVLPLIREKFGKLRSGVVPSFPEYKEVPFKGREFYKVRMSPIKLGVRVYRAVAAGHPDESTLNVIAAMLNNSSQTGLIDELSTERKIMGAGMFNLAYKDHGAIIFFFLPKIVGQSLGNAEEQVTNCIEKIKTGTFDDGYLHAIINELLLEKQKELENISSRAVLLGQLFSMGLPADRILKEMEEIQQVNREMIVQAANAYFSKDVMVLYSKTGFPKKKKLKKPGFKPVIADQTAESEYQKKFKTIPEKQVSPRFLNFKEDLHAFTIHDKHRLIVSGNPQNNIFTLEIAYQTNVLDNPAVEAAFNAMNYIETESLKSTELKKMLQQMGIILDYRTNQNEAIIAISGLESNLEAALQILETIIKEGRLTDKVIPILVDEMKADEKFNMTSAAHKADLVYEYVMYGKDAPELNRMSYKELKKVNPSALLDAFKNSIEYEAEVRYVGKKDPAKIKSLFEELSFLSKTPLKSEHEYCKTMKEIVENRVYILPDSKSLQSQIYLIVTSPEVRNDEKYKMDAFNDYFGNSFSGLVLQEIREYRSLAYSAWAMYKRGEKPGVFSYLHGSMGVQADKTNEAIAVFDSLIHFMPQKEERINSIKSNLINLATSSYPEFRKIPVTYSKQTKLGYNESPWISDLPKYQAITFTEITDFYQAHVKDKKRAIIVVGNTSRFDVKDLEKYGKIIHINEKMIKK